MTTEEYVQQLFIENQQLKQEKALLEFKVRQMEPVYKKHLRRELEDVLSEETLSKLLADETKYKKSADVFLDTGRIVDLHKGESIKKRHSN
jgi:hypothetical protein